MALKIFLMIQVVYGDVYMLDVEMKWKVLSAMPKPNSHIECAWVIVNNSIIITGGTTEKHPETNRMMLVGEVFQFQLDSLVLFFSLEFGVCIFLTHMHYSHYTRVISLIMRDENSYQIQIIE